MDHRNYTVEVKNVQVSNLLGNEGAIFQAVIYVNGQRIGPVRNRGDGGGNIYDFSRSHLKQLTEWAQEKYPDNHVNPLDMAIAVMIDDIEERKYLKNLCRTHVVLKLKGQPPGEYQTVRITKGKVWTQKNKTWAENRYKGQIEMIYNQELFGDPKE